MKPINNQLLVKFDLSETKTFRIGDIELLRPEKWVAVEGTETKHTQYEENWNHRETNPLIATVVGANPRFPYKVGDKLFTHYLAYENREIVDYNGDQFTFINGEFVFFTINEDGSISMVPGLYLGEQVYTESETTASGILLSAYENKKESLLVKITNAPEESEEVCVGDIVITPDDYQYYLKYEGKEYIKLAIGNYSEIICKLTDPSKIKFKSASGEFDQVALDFMSKINSKAFI